MRPSRSFRPSAPAALEGRVVPSALAASAAVERPVRLSAAEIAQSNASNTAFGMSASATIHSGQPVAEQLTTRYADGSAQTESLVATPNPSNNSMTTHKTIQLRNNGGTETVVDTETFSGGATPFSGTNNVHTITTTLPDGTTQTEIETEAIVGPRTFLNATLHEANGSVETWTSTNVRHGRTTVANKTITEPNGTIEHQRSVTTRHGSLDWTTKTTTTLPGEITVTSAATNVIRVQPPAH